jgi:hypothetical protein
VQAGLQCGVPGSYTPDMDQPTVPSAALSHNIENETFRSIIMDPEQKNIT